MHKSYAANMQGALSSGAGVQVLISFSSHQTPDITHIQTNYTGPGKLQPKQNIKPSSASSRMV